LPRGRKYHAVGTRHLPTNFILNYVVRSFWGAIKSRKKIRVKKLIVKLKMGIFEKGYGGAVMKKLF
jgi:hypothetical protein